jgi:hypothetical protein
MNVSRCPYFFFFARFRLAFSAALSASDLGTLTSFFSSAVILRWPVGFLFTTLPFVVFSRTSTGAESPAGDAHRTTVIAHSHLARPVAGVNFGKHGAVRPLIGTQTSHQQSGFRSIPRQNRATGPRGQLPAANVPKGRDANADLAQTTAQLVGRQVRILQIPKTLRRIASSPDRVRERGALPVRKIRRLSASSNPHKSRVILICQDAVGQSLTDNAAQHTLEANPVAGFTVVESPDLFGDVAGQVERRNSGVRSANRPLQQTPEVFHAVDVNLADGVATGVVDHLVEVRQRQVAVSAGAIGEDSGPVAYMRADLGHQRMRRFAADHSGPNRAMRLPVRALQNAVDGCFAGRPPPRNHLLAPRLVHVSGLPANVRRIRFAGAVHLLKRAGFHRGANTVKHEPSRLLRNAQRAGQFTGTNPVLRIGDAPHGDKPFRQGQRRILENRVHLRRDLLAAILTPNHAARSDLPDAVALRTAMRTFDSFGPFHLDHQGVTNIGLRVVSNGFNQRFRGGHDIFLGGNRVVFTPILAG